MKNFFYSSILCLEDGVSYKGWSLFNVSTTSGEIVFNTGMTGYQEIFTDPSYTGQIITFTYPELGNTGLNSFDNESYNLNIKGIVAKNICLQPSNWRQSMTIKDYLKNYKIPHIFGIDTRSLTKHIRSRGVMKACISSILIDVDTLVRQLTMYREKIGVNLIKYVIMKTPYALCSDKNKSSIAYNCTYETIKSYDVSLMNIIILDFGIKHNILSSLSRYGCNIIVLPSNATYSMISFYKPNAILLSNGPGNPAQMNYAIHTIRKIISFANIPVFGICMGHQLLSIACGASTSKLKFGHRGLNHPVGLNQSIEITSQNHGFIVNIKSLNSLTGNKDIRMMYFNGNDQTLAGIISLKRPFFSVQYHPESSPGPHDSEHLFIRFIHLMCLYQ
uniref:Carbamoyl phosphate synthase small chain n=1 Tax=Crouania attenuata TaxID=42002 RepID=A0A4D6WNK2_9FLOR|nr:Carbamoyl phosphate synthase small subunit [Crouania attenuata]